MESFFYIICFIFWGNIIFENSIKFYILLFGLVLGLFIGFKCLILSSFYEVGELF